MAGARDLVDRLHASEGSRLMRVFRASLRSPQDAADATQETFLRLLGGHVWMPLPIRSPICSRSPARSPSPSTAAPPGIGRFSLRRPIRKSPHRCQQVFILSRLHGLPNGEIAVWLSISCNMVEKC